MIQSISLILIYKFQITNSKSQIISNDQNTKFETKSGLLNLLINSFWSLKFRIWDLFVIWCLWFEIFPINGTEIVIKLLGS